MAVMLDLRPDRSLLDPKFESYRLSLDSFPVLKKIFSCGVEHEQLGDEQYGFLHAHLSSLLNHLFYDPWAQECVFFIDSNRHFQWSRLTSDGRLSDLRTVWHFPTELAKSSRGNATVSFAGPEWAVVLDGINMLHLLSTPSRSEGEPWQMVFNEEISSSSFPCLLLSSLHQQFPSYQQIDCVVAYISKIKDLPDNPVILKEAKDKAQSPEDFVCVLEWITFVSLQGSENDGWHRKRNRRLVGRTVPVYTCLEPGSTCLNLVAEKKFTFTFDSDKPEIDCPSENGDKESAAPPLPPLYTFMQSLEDVTVLFKAPESLSKSSISVNMELRALHVKVDDKLIIGGPLAGTIDVSSSTWTLEGNKLELTLSKSKAGEKWKELVLGDKRGQEVYDPALVEEIHSRLAHLTSETEVSDDGKPSFNMQELEECDYSMDILLFQRLDGNTHCVTHQSNLGGHQWLFSQMTSTENLPVLCLRHDVDGIVWQPENTASEGEMQNFKIGHIATFPALGYVLASKSDRKYIVSSQDFSFVAVCDGNRHVYIYRQPESLHSALELRNRKTGQDVSKIARQHVINLEDSDNILGLYANRDCIFVLNQKALYGIKV